MAHISHLKAHTEVKCPPDTIFNFLKNNLTDLAKIFPEVYKKVELLEAAEGGTGNIVLMQYEIGGHSKTDILKAEIDEEEKSITYKSIEGEIKRIYKGYAAKFSFNQNGSATISIAYEKADTSSPNPDEFANIGATVIKRVDAYLFQK